MKGEIEMNKPIYLADVYTIGALKCVLKSFDNDCPITPLSIRYKDDNSVEILMVDDVCAEIVEVEK